MFKAAEIVNLKQHPQHLELLAQWHHAEWEYLNPGQSLQDRINNMQQYLGHELVPSTYIALLDEQLTGSAAVIDNDMDTHPEISPWLASVFVAPGFRKQGIGSKLVQTVMREVKQAGLGQLHLFTPDQVSFYRGIGWTVLQEEIYRGERVTVMVVELEHW